MGSEGESKEWRRRAGGEKKDTIVLWGGGSYRKNNAAETPRTYDGTMVIGRLEREQLMRKKKGPRSKIVCAAGNR